MESVWGIKDYACYTYFACIKGLKTGYTCGCKVDCGEKEEAHGEKQNTLSLLRLQIARLFAV